MRPALLSLAAAAGFALAVVPAVAHDESIGTTSSTWTKEAVAVAPGHKVTVQNTGGYHDLVWGDGAAGVAEPGPAWVHERTFTAGDDGKAITFRCTVHGAMTGTVHVNQSETVPQPGSPSGGSTPTGSTTTTGTATTPTTAEPTTGGSAPDATTTQPDSETGAPAAPPQSGTAPGVQDIAERDRTAPGVTRLRVRVERRRLVLRLRVDEAARVTVRVLRAGRLVARGAFRVRPGGNRLVLRRRLPAGALTTRVTVADHAGNVTRRRARVRR